jgi:hypothetical protein
MLTTFIILDALIGIQVLMMIAAAVVLFVVLRRALKSLETLQTSALDLLPKVDQILERVNGLVKASEPIGGSAADITADVKRIVESTRGSVEHVTQVVNDVSARAKTQAERMDAVLADTLDRFERISATVTENLVAPMAEISAVLRGGYAAAKYLRRQRTPSGAPGDGHEEQQSQL